MDCDGLLLIQMEGNGRNSEGPSKSKTAISVVLKHPKTSYVYKCNIWIMFLALQQSCLFLWILLMLLKWYVGPSH